MTDLLYLLVKKQQKKQVWFKALHIILYIQNKKKSASTFIEDFRRVIE